MRNNAQLERKQIMTRDEIAHIMQETSGQHWGDEAHFQRFAARLLKAEQDRCCQIIYGMCDSDNVAQRTVDKIRRGE